MKIKKEDVIPAACDSTDTQDCTFASIGTAVNGDSYHIYTRKQCNIDISGKDDDAIDAVLLEQTISLDQGKMVLPTYSHLSILLRCRGIMRILFLLLQYVIITVVLMVGLILQPYLESVVMGRTAHSVLSRFSKKINIPRLRPELSFLVNHYKSFEANENFVKDYGLYLQPSYLQHNELPGEGKEYLGWRASGLQLLDLR